MHVAFPNSMSCPCTGGTPASPFERDTHGGLGERELVGPGRISQKARDLELQSWKCWHSQPPQPHAAHQARTRHEAHSSVTASTRPGAFLSPAPSSDAKEPGRPAPPTLQLSVTWLSHGRHPSPGHATAQRRQRAAHPKPPALSPRCSLWRPLSKGPDSCQVRLRTAELRAHAGGPA